ncbi:MAG: serine hydrolase [Bryobacterales bacterium]|nr:serine hydrolase [Bryobacterales bacterium]
MLPIATRLASLILIGSAYLFAQDLDRRIRAEVAGFDGQVNLYARNLDSGAAYGLGEDEKVRTASTIKLPVMVAAFAAVERGEARWSDTLILRDSGKVSGSGVLQELSDGLRLTLKDAVTLMIVVSDNTATNLVIDRFGADAVNAEMDRLGLRRTRCLRKVMSDGGQAAGFSAAGRLEENRRFGLGVSTPREMVLLLEKIERGQVVSPAASTEMIAILKRQQFKDGIGRHLDSPVASKSGALDHLRSDVGIAYTPGGRIALAITVDKMPVVDYSPDNAGNRLISTLTRILVDGLSGGRR